MLNGGEVILLGQLIGEFHGKSTTTRVLSDGKIESTDQGTGKILGVDASSVWTGVLTPMPNGVVMGEGNGLITTMDGDTVLLKISGIGWSTGKGWKGTYRGVLYQITESQKLMSLNKVVSVYEYDADENGDFKIKFWEWK